MGTLQAESYSREDLQRILRLSKRQMEAWVREGFVSGPGPYTFSDLIALRTVQRLRKSNVPLKKIARSVKALKRKLNEVEHPLTELRISSDGRRIIVSYDGAAMESDSGQFLMDFETRDLRSTVRALKVPPQSVARRKEEAEQWFLKGLSLEERPETIADAIQAYTRAIELNPEAAGAYINLGTIYYNSQRLDEAERCYRAAIQIDPQYSLAFFNLGNVFDERGNLQEARQHYEQALRLTPNYGDAHYNLALVYDKLAQRGKAVHHWRAYLKLDPASPWAAYARQQLTRNPLKVVSPESATEPRA